jgi:signal transduction histidine kinase
MARRFRQPSTLRSVSAWSLALDAVIAAVATAYSIASVLSRTHLVGKPKWVQFNGVFILAGGGEPRHVVPSIGVLAGVALMAAPLALRRVYPAAACAVIFAAVLALPGWAPADAFGTAILAAYSAVVYSPYRELAVAAPLAGAVAAALRFPDDSLPRISGRFVALLIFGPTVAVALAMRGWKLRARDSAARLRLVQAEHEEATRQAIELERARIASELHDVVTHNVSVMMVQAGAARKVLGSPRADAGSLAEDALLAVEASGRTAMAELRNLLGLLAPRPVATDRDGTIAVRGEDLLVPPPGLGDVEALVERVVTAGLPVRLHCSLSPGGLPAGVDLAVYRVVQEGLTNVLRHGGGTAADVRISGRLGQLVVTVSDDGRGGSGSKPGRGLLGLRERVALYGGSLDAGPRPGGGWRVRATIPLPRP